jgi:hypothetical protein
MLDALHKDIGGTRYRKFTKVYKIDVRNVLSRFMEEIPLNNGVVLLSYVILKELRPLYTGRTS